MNFFQRRDLAWGLPLSLVLGAGLSALQPGNWLIGFLGFSFLFFLSFFLLSSAARWGGPDTDHRKSLAWMVALAFLLRFAGGVTTYLALPVYGHADDEEQSAGFTYTDAYRRDGQAWELASSDRPILDAFNSRFASDQYGGLLAFCAFIYRYFSPDAHRVLMLVLMSALMGALGVPFLWKAVNLQWGEKVATASGWIFALYPESTLLGGVPMREPYLLAFSAFCLWGFMSLRAERSNLPFETGRLLREERPRNDIIGSDDKRSLTWLALGILGMLLVSPSIALVTLVILSGWMYFSSERGRFPWWAAVILGFLFIAGLFLLSGALDRQGNLGGGGPLGVIQTFIRESFKWNAYKIEEGSGWVQKLFDEMPDWMELPFVMIYGVLQPILPAILIAPTNLLWKAIGIFRAIGWYALLPALILSFGLGSAKGGAKSRSIILWLSFIVWGWILFTALRGGGDQWDNPRYRLILFVWQAIPAGHVWVWWRETRNVWVGRVIAMELVLVAVFTQWYLNRYLHFGGQLPFVWMVALILGSWIAIIGWGVWRDRKAHGV
ncbi:MAG: hypothetical protein L6Q49_03555 [Anaerolineales bacterium]|nr:hypothetical protein [Anaerolineales bacterium]